jgi:hypothetical protein
MFWHAPGQLVDSQDRWAGSLASRCVGGRLNGVEIYIHTYWWHWVGRSWWEVVGSLCHYIYLAKSKVRCRIWPGYTDHVTLTITFWDPAHRPTHIPENHVIRSTFFSFGVPCPSGSVGAPVWDFEINRAVGGLWGLRILQEKLFGDTSAHFLYEKNFMDLYVN